MRKVFMLLICMNIFFMVTQAQQLYSLSGKIVNGKNEPLAGASLLITPLNKGAVTGVDGFYAFQGLSAGSYRLEVSFVGHRSIVDTVHVSGNTVYNTSLWPVPLNLQEVVVADNYATRRRNEESLNIELVNSAYLKRNMGGSLMKSLERLPGVSAMDIGSGHSKPVIRGLSFNRVVVVENGIKHEGQQWGDDHGLEIDQYAVDNVEVIKGPASLMYGSDAIGGVIDIKHNNIPLRNTFGGTVDLFGKTFNNLYGTSLSLFVRKEKLYLNLRSTLIDYGDYKVPADSIDIYSFRVPLANNYLRNTAGYERNFHATAGFVSGRLHSRLLLSNVNSKSGFFANAHGLEPRRVDAALHDKSNRDVIYPYQEFNHFKLISKSRWEMDKFLLEADFGYQRNFRSEWSQYVQHGYMPAVFPDTLPFPSDLEREFDKQIVSGTIKSTHTLSTKTSVSAGINSEYQDNRIDGNGFVIPNFNQITIGAFAFAKHAFSDASLLQFGMRYDYGSIKTKAYYDWFPSPADDNSRSYLLRSPQLNPSYSNVSWSVGYNFNTEVYAFKVNGARSFRMPIVNELAANGVSYKKFRYEVGNPDLSPEIAYQLDAGGEYNGARFAIGLSPFVNYFTNYIYLDPGFVFDRLYGNGNQIYNYKESTVFRYGGEVHAHYQLFKNLQLGVIGEYVYARQLSGEKKGYTLPFSPPSTLVINAKYQSQHLGSFHDPYLSVDFKAVARQNNIVPPEEPTEGYRVINVGVGGSVKWLNQTIWVSLQVQNLLNSTFFNHTSYYRLINVPEPGRNISLNISVPITGRLKNESTNY